MLSKSCNVIWTSNNTEQPWCACLQTFMICHFTTNDSDEFGWDEADESGSHTLLLQCRHAQFSQALSSIKLRLNNFVPYGMAISINILIYFMLTKLDCILLLGFHKVLKSNRSLTMKMDSDVCFYWSKLRKSRFDYTSYGKPTVLNGHFKSNMMGSWHKWPQPLPSHTLHT
jgi:hypothetical protein